MDDRLQMGVVIVEDVARHAVDEGGVHDVEPLAPPEQRGLRRPGERRERGDRDIDRLVMRAADGDADPVQQRAHAFLADIGRQVIVAARDEIMRQRARDVFRRLLAAGAAAGVCARAVLVATVASGSAAAAWSRVLRSVRISGLLDLDRHQLGGEPHRALQRAGLGDALPTISKAVPCDGVVKTVSSPAVTVTPRLKPRSLVAIWPWS